MSITVSSKLLYTEKILKCTVRDFFELSETFPENVIEYNSFRKLLHNSKKIF